MAIKPGASVKGITPEILFAVQEARQWCREHAHVFVIEDCNGGQSFNMRSSNMGAGEKASCVKWLTRALGDEYKVVLERTHIRVKFDP